MSRSRILFLSLILGSVLLFFHHPARYAALAILRAPFVATRFGVRILLHLPSLPVLTEENQRLRAELLQRQLEVSRLREAIRTQAQEQTLQALTPENTQGVVAHVIGRSSLPTQASVLIDKGQRDGLALDTVVLDADGVVGRVQELHLGTALVVLITDTESRIAAMVERTRETGLLNGGPTGELELRYLDDDADVRPQDHIVTAGLGGPFPKGLLLGEVVAVDRDKASGMAWARIKPASQLGRLEEVLCLVPQPQDSE